MPKFNIGDEVEFSDGWWSTSKNTAPRDRWIGKVTHINRLPFVDVVWTDTTGDYGKVVNAPYKEKNLSLRKPPKELKEYM
jgi:hypothetical protein